MRDLVLPAEGSCRCGKIRFQISAPPLMTAACHCRGCQKMSSSAYSLSAAIPSEVFRIVDGEPVIGGLHGASQHFCCPHCMSWLFTRPEGIDFIVNVRPTMFDETGWFEPFIETYVSEAFAWAKTGAVHSFEKFPEMSAFGPLMEEFAARYGAPG
ncbi:GFA family protein [Afifella sp. IM 167]|uniref:GFA family protein n=1 Tax=Afifella sp. IM 167 TaxID=2033586 RepID=UPI001CCC5F9B|nr:GFA family protein [Afifella sp. IM 167]MBZ8131753.1 aldehyde-activating protein [Afifella sp. IM 167]